MEISLWRGKIDQVQSKPRKNKILNGLTVVSKGHGNDSQVDWPLDLALIVAQILDTILVFPKLGSCQENLLCRCKQEQQKSPFVSNHSECFYHVLLETRFSVSHPPIEVLRHFVLSLSPMCSTLRKRQCSKFSMRLDPIVQVNCSI